MAKKNLTWIDERSVLRLDGKIYAAGDSIPAGILPKPRIKLFKELKMIELISEVEDIGDTGNDESSKK